MNIVRISQNVTSVDLKGNSLTVYHRTKDQDIAGNICSIGFMSGLGAAYGRGIYTTYDLKSSLRNYNLTTYGRQLVKASVDIYGFLIFDYDLSKQIYGNNYRIVDQIKNIIGEEKVLNSSLNKKSQWDDLEKASDQLFSVKWTSDIASRISNRYKLDSTGLNGIIFTGRNDGRVCLSYKEILVVPMSHAWIDGKTYRNPRWEQCDQRSMDKLNELKQDHERSQKYIKERQKLLKDLNVIRSGDTIELDESDYPNVPKEIFYSLLTNYLYEDEERIKQLSPSLRENMKDVIEVELLIRNLKSAPTVHWDKFEKLSDSVKAKIPKELIIKIWDDFIKENKGYWKSIPDSIRGSIDKEHEAKYWLGLIKKNTDNWKYVHPEISQYIKDNFNIEPPKGAYSDQSDTRDSIDDTSETSETIYETSEIEVPKSAMGWVQDNISKMNKKAGRLGLPPITHEVISENNANRTQTIKIIGNVPSLKGWKLIARIVRVSDESGEEYNAVETLSDDGLPPDMDLDNASMDCHHCGHKRKRKECYIVKNEGSTDSKYKQGQYLMIGSTCLGDFIGDMGTATTPDSIVKYAQQFQSMLTLFKEGSQYQNKSDQDIRTDFRKKGVPIVFFLTKVMQLKSQGDFVSRGQAYNQGKTSTADLAWQMCTNLKTDQFYSTGVSATDLATIYNALEWISQIDEPTNTSDKRSNFLYNLKQSCEIGSVYNRQGKGNIGIVSWLPTIYLQHIDENIDKSQIIGKDGQDVYFYGIVTGKTPVLVQISQQVNKSINNTQNYIIASSDGKKVAWMEEEIISANINDPVYIKGKVESNIPIESNVAATILREVKEISEEEYLEHKPYMDRQIKSIEQEVESSKPLDVPGSPKGNYIDGTRIVEEYRVVSIKPVRSDDELYILKDNYNSVVSVFSDDNLGRPNDPISVGDKLILSGIVKIKGQYINLLNVTRIGDVSEIKDDLFKDVPKDYSDGQEIEDDFKITGVYPASYGNMRYNLVDSYGRNISAFLNNDIGGVGDTVRLKGKIKIKGQYINLQRVKVVPRSATPPSTPVKPSDNDKNDEQSTDDVDVQSLSSFNWYKNASWFKKEDDDQSVLEDDMDKTEQNDEFIGETQETKERKYKNPDEIDLDEVYNMFHDSYVKSTGKAWDKDKFLRRSGNWIFYGDQYGYIAVRPQRSGLYHLTAIAGDDSNPLAKGKSLLKAFQDLMSDGKPVWGMVSADLRTMSSKLGMKSISGDLIQRIIKFIPKTVLGGATITGFLPDGGVQISYQDIGDVVKYFVCNQEYIDWLKNQIDHHAYVPSPVKFMIKKQLDKVSNKKYILQKLSCSFAHVENFIDLDELLGNLD